MLSGLCEIIFLFFSVVDKNLVSRKGIFVGLLNTLIVTIWYLLKYKAWKEDGNMEMGKEKKKKKKKNFNVVFFFSSVVPFDVMGLKIRFFWASVHYCKNFFFFKSWQAGTSERGLNEVI